MYRRFLVSNGALVISFAWLNMLSTAAADDSQQQQRRQQQNQASNDRDASRQQQNDQDDEETEYRGMEHAALGALLSERQGGGVRIRDVLPDSPAAEAGLTHGDRITKIDGQAMNTYRDVIRFINRVAPEQTATIVVMRDGAEKSFKVKFAPRQEVYANDRQFGQARDNRDSGRDDSDHQRSPSRDDRRGDQNRAVLGVDLAANQNHAVISEVRPQGAAQAAGLRPGDELMAINDRTIANKDDLRNQLRHLQPGDQVNVTFRRQGREQTTSAELGSSYASTAENHNGWGRMQDRMAGRSGYQRWSISEHHPALGVTLEENNEGTLSISRVVSGGPAEKAGAQRGDKLLSIDNQDVDSVGDVMRQISGKQPGDTVTLHIRRDGKKQDLQATLRPVEEVFRDGRTAARSGSRDERDDQD